MAKKLPQIGDRVAYSADSLQTWIGHPQHKNRCARRGVIKCDAAEFGPGSGIVTVIWDDGFEAAVNLGHLAKVNSTAFREPTHSVGKFQRFEL